MGWKSPTKNRLRFRGWKQRRQSPRRSGITYVDFNTGHYDGDAYLDILEPYLVRIKKELGLLVGFQTPPHRDLKRYDALREMGLNRVSLCFEIGVLPDECHSLSPRRFLLQTLKLKAMSKVFRHRFERRLEAAAP